MPMEVNSVDVVDGAVGPMASFSSIVKVEKCCLTRVVGRCDSRDLWWRGLEPYHLPIPGPILDCQTWVVPIDWTLAFFWSTFGNRSNRDLSSNCFEQCLEKKREVPMAVTWNFYTVDWSWCFLWGAWASVDPFCGECGSRRRQPGAGVGSMWELNQLSVSATLQKCALELDFLKSIGAHAQRSTHDEAMNSISLQWLPKRLNCCGWIIQGGTTYIHTCVLVKCSANFLK